MGPATRQFPAQGNPGITYRTDHLGGPEPICETLLYHDDDGALAGVLNYFPNDIPAPPGSLQAALTNPERRFIERAGHFYMIVDPSRQRHGIGMKLLSEAVKRWAIDFERQDYTAAGASLVEGFLNKNPDHMEPEVDGQNSGSRQGSQGA